MPRRLDLIGKQFGSWTVRKYLGQSRWECHCKCDRILPVQTGALTSGESKSCGCQSGCPNIRESRLGQTAHPLYLTWSRMHERCENKNHQAYARYGGRGITVCNRWSGTDGFFNFVSDMGDKPKRTTLDRKDNNKGYYPENCQWADAKKQNRNRSNNRLLTYNNEIMCMSAWAEKLGKDRYWLKNQLRYKSLTTVIESLKYNQDM